VIAAMRADECLVRVVEMEVTRELSDVASPTKRP
jgi:hypothetical protein